LQIEYSLVERTVERELIPMAKALGLGVTAWSPLAGGALTGKYSGATKEEGRYLNEMMQAFLPEKERQDRAVAAVKAISGETGRSPAQVALAWFRYREVPVIPIIGARKLSQFQDNLASLTLDLNAAQVSRLDEASAIPLGFPHDFYRRDMVRNFVFGGMRDRIIAK